VICLPSAYDKNKEKVARNLAKKEKKSKKKSKLAK
tara:strand:- start:1417 stop:1521 length:105 start_codon:yes stop_codon:yes gene_type:complete